MPRFVILSKLSPSGDQAIKSDPELLPDLAAEVEKVGGKIIEEYMLLGPYDHCTIVEVRDNDAAQLLKVADHGADTSSRELMPAIDLQLFVRLLGQSTENSGPHKWQISPPAVLIRRLFRRHAYTGLAKRYCKPMTIVGAQHFEKLSGPAIFISNHTSFMDGSALFAALPKRYQGKVAFPAAADRFFIKGRRDFRKQGWWFSLVYNSYPMRRGGGRSALEYSDWLISKGWSLVIFPEGARTSAAKLARFRMGPAILATTHGIPVVPMYLEGLAAIRPKGSKVMTPGPVTVRVGEPLRFPAGSDATEANKQLYKAVEALAQDASAARRAARATASTLVGV